MDIEALKCFIKLYEEKNFTKAAKDLFTSQQALSRTIIKLEDEIGQALFVRESRGVSPTDLATYLYPKAQKLVQTFNDFAADARLKAGQEKKDKITPLEKDFLDYFLLKKL